MQTPIDPLVAEMVELLDANAREMFEERSALREHDGGLDRAFAESLGLLDVLNKYPAALSDATIFQIDIDGHPHWFLTTSEELAREHIQSIAGTECAVSRDVAFVVDHEFGGLAEVVVAE